MDCSRSWSRGMLPAFLWGCLKRKKGESTIIIDQEDAQNLYRICVIAIQNIDERLNKPLYRKFADYLGRQQKVSGKDQEDDDEEDEDHQEDSEDGSNNEEKDDEEDSGADEGNPKKSPEGKSHDEDDDDDEPPPQNMSGKSVASKDAMVSQRVTLERNNRACTQGTHQVYRML